MVNEKKTAGLRGRYKITNRTKVPKPELSDEELIRSLEKYASVPTPTKENVGGLLTTPMRGKMAFRVIVNGFKPSFFTQKPTTTTTPNNATTDVNRTPPTPTPPYNAKRAVAWQLYQQQDK